MLENMSLAAIEWQYVLGYTPLEVIATLAGVISLILLAKEKILAWPLGLVWAGISAYLAFTSWQLVSDGILYLLYIPIQIYCWMVWVRNGGVGKEEAFVPTWLPRRTQVILVLSTLLCIGLWAISISTLAEKIAWIPTPVLLLRDSATTVLNFFAQFLMAKKRMENWVFWLIVNVLGIHIYLLQDSPIYAAQYALFLLLGIYGWWKWHHHRRNAVAA
jgi:nicotinamide mononucleotide transporter